MNKDTFTMLQRLTSLGISMDDAYALRRAAMTLSRWHELECGDGNDYGSWAIERIPVTRRAVSGNHSVGGVRVPVKVPRGTECKYVDNLNGLAGGGWVVADISKVKGSNAHDLETRYVSIDKDDVAELPFLVHHHYQHGKGKDYTTRTRIPDRERGAEKRLATIMARYPDLAAYIQGDPRGASLYVGRKDDMARSYTNGVAVFK